MELLELFNPPVVHTEPEEKCPFCPIPEEKKFTTYAGAKKSEANLRDIMAEPNKLTSKESGTRPKKGEQDQQNEPDARKMPSPPREHPEFGAYTFEAHHLIPGKEKITPKGNKKVMSGHPIEKWIIKGKQVKGDSGYSINNTENGVWLPSPPKAVKKNRGNPNPDRPWASAAKSKNNPKALTMDEKTEIAEYAMAAGLGQFHYGHHKILNEEGLHFSYAKHVENCLTEAEKFLKGWSEACFCDPAQSKPPKPPFKATWKFNQALDDVSKSIERDIKIRRASKWEYFISTFAKDFAKKESQKRRTL